MFEDTSISAVSDLDAHCFGRRELFAPCRDGLAPFGFDDGRVYTLAEPVINTAEREQGRHHPCAFGLHNLQPRRVGKGAMFDGSDARCRRFLNPARAMRMRGDFQAKAPGRLDNRCDFGRGEMPL